MEICERVRVAPMKRSRPCPRTSAGWTACTSLRDGSLLITDWNSGSLARWSPKTGMQTLASGFKGPADFCVIPDAQGLTVIVPDLVQSQLRIVRLDN